ncbi:hypothetical protein JUM41_24990 [Rhizobium pusense]|uniref:hypothetical protein n=1 Tax=Agrobacterium pusense TaxID=648995 RepID=UPI001FCDE914|nr:hypothetical protein [Agrobacterium pusense]MCJ2877505.1 hypothetical protein [Agrobacterium pusense]
MAVVDNTMSSSIWRVRLRSYFDRRNRVVLALNGFWFLVFVSWLPMIADIESVLVRLRLGESLGDFVSRPRLLYFVLIAIGILGFGLLGRLAHRPLVLFCCMLPAVISIILSDPETLLANMQGQSISRLVTPIGLVAVLLSAACFTIRGKIRSLAVAAFLLLAALEALSGLYPFTPEAVVGADGTPVASSGDGQVFLTFGRLFHSYNLSFLDLLILGTIIVFGRFLFLLWQHNQPAFGQVRQGLSRENVLKTIWLAVPFFAMIVVLNIFWGWVGNHAEQQAIAALQVEGQPVPTTLHDALEQASLNARSEFANQSRAGIDRARAAIVAGGESSLGAMTSIRGAFPAEIMHLKGCRWYDVFCHVVNGIKSVVNSVYRKARDTALNAAESKLREINDDVNLSAEQKQARALEVINSLEQQSASWITAALAKSFEAARWTGLLLAIYAVMVAIKTVMVIFSRILYRDRPENELFASLGKAAPSKSLLTKAPKVLGSEVEFSPGTSDTYVVLRYEIRDAVPNLALAQPLKAIVSRVISGRYFLGFLPSSALKNRGASIVVNSPAELVGWELAEGESIVFHYGDIVSFSRSITLSTEVNLSLQATLFGRFIFHKATGPGLIVMQTKGEAVAGKQRDAAEARRASSLKAWDLNAGFQIQSNLDWRGVYLAPYNIRKNTKSLVIYDAGPQNVKWSPIGLIKAIRTFLLPV